MARHPIGKRLTQVVRRLLLDRELFQKPPMPANVNFRCNNWLKVHQRMPSGKWEDLENENKPTCVTKSSDDELVFRRLLHQIDIEHSHPPPPLEDTSHSVDEEEDQQQTVLQGDPFTNITSSNRLACHSRSIICFVAIVCYPVNRDELWHPQLSPHLSKRPNYCQKQARFLIN